MSRVPCAGWRSGVSADELRIGAYRLRAGAIAWEIEAIVTKGNAAWCEAIVSGITVKGPIAAKLEAEDAAASLLDVARVALGLPDLRARVKDLEAALIEACDLAETMFTNWTATDRARVDRNLGNGAESEAMDEIERLRFLARSA